MATVAELAVNISANMADFNRKMNAASKKVEAVGRSMANAGQKLSVGLTLPLAAAGAGAVKAAADFEQAMVEVEKVTNPETANKMSDAILRMSKTIPLAQTELANLTAQAARFGIRGADNIEAFTTSVSKMSIATDLSAERAGEALARVSKLTGVPAKEVENLGSAVNELSNNFATSSSEIVDAMLRSGAAASQFGLNAQQIAGVSASLNAVSESSERAGTRMRRLFQEAMNPDKVNKIASALGMTTSEFQRMVKNSPEQALLSMIEAMKQNGNAANQLRTELSTTSQQALAGLAQNSDEVTKALDTSAKAYRENTSLQREFSAAIQSFWKQLTLAWNKIKIVAMTLGNMLMPIVLKVVDIFVDLARKFKNLGREGKKTAIAIAGIAAATGPALFVLGKLGPVAFKAFGAVASAATMASRGIRLAMASTGIGLFVAALGTAVAAIIAHWNKIVRYFKNNSIGTIMSDMASAVKEGAEFVIGAFRVMFDGIKSVFNKGQSSVGAIFKGIWSVIKTISKAIWGLVKEVFGGIVDLFVHVADAANQSFGFVIDLFRGDIPGALNHLKNAFDTIFLGILKLIEGAINGILELLAKLVESIPGVGDKMAKGLRSAQDSVTNFRKQVTDALKLNDEEARVNSMKNSLLNFADAAKKAGEGTLDFSNALEGLGGGGQKEDGQGGGQQSGMSKIPMAGEGQSQPGGLRGPGKIDEMPNKINKATESMKGLKAMTDKFGSSLDRITSMFNQSVAAVMSGTQKASEAFKGFGKRVRQILVRLIMKLVKTVILAAALSALTGGAVGFGSMFSSGMSGGIGSMLSNIPSMDSGGITRQDTLAQLHANEAVVPLDRLGKMIGGRQNRQNPSNTIELVADGDQMQATLDNNFNTKERMGV